MTTGFDARARAAAAAVHRVVADRPVAPVGDDPAPVAHPPRSRWAAAAVLVALALAAGLLVSRDGATRDDDAAATGWAVASASLATGWQAVSGAGTGLDGGHVEAVAVLDDRGNEPVLVAVGQTAGAPAAWVGTPRRWRRVGVEAFGPEGFVSGVAVTPLGVVAVGSTELRPSGAPAAWRSPDGRQWTRAIVQPGPAGTGWMAAVTAGGPGLVAVGRAGAGDGAAGAAWTSVDGSEWRPVPGADGDAPGAMDAVATTPQGLVAVGAGDVWASTDGTVWSRRTVTTIGRLRDVAAHGDRVVAVGSDDVGGTPFAATWSSDDGEVWRRRPREADVLGPGVVATVTRWRGGLVAMGSGPSLWASADGRDWQLVRLDAGLFRGASVRRVVALDDGRLLAFGSVSLTPTIWTWSPPA